jgi:RecA-family ATPase
MIDVPGQNGNGAARVSNLFEQNSLSDMELEALILGTCIIHPHYLKELDLTDRDFASTAHRTVWNAIVAVYANDGICDTPLVRAHLAESGKLANVGGLEYLLSLTDTIPSNTPPVAHASRLKRLAIQRRLRNALVFHATHVQDPEVSARYKREIDALHAQLDALSDSKSAAPLAHRLDEHWKTVGELGLLDTLPEPQAWVLMRPSTETLGMANPIGLLPRSEVGFVLGPGGLGKSIMMMGLAISVATGRKWLDHFIVSEPGRVLLILGEEKLKQAHRRLYELCTSMRLTSEQAQLVRERVVLMPLSGVMAPLVRQEGGLTTETDVAQWLRARMQSADWTLVIVDPVSRFAGADTESDNVQATRFVQTVETLCSVPGAPTVLLVHHSNKISRADDAARPSAADSRGASALTDAGRWCANLVRRKDGGVALHFTKNNYAEQYDEPVLLERTFGGYLRVETAEAKQRHVDAQERALATKDAELRERILKLLARRPGLSKTDIRDDLKADRTAVFRIVAELAESGELVEAPKHAYCLPPRQGGLPDG